MGAVMDLNEARRTLCHGGSFSRLFGAVGTISMEGPPSVADDWHLWLALAAPGVVAEQAMFALYRRTGRALPENRDELVDDPYQWGQWLLQSHDFAQLPIAAFDRASGVDFDSLQALVRRAIQDHLSASPVLEHDAGQATDAVAHPIDAAS